MVGPNFPYTQLDDKQIVRQSFDESTDRLRVDIGAVIDLDGDLEVAIDADKDSIKIGEDSDGPFLAINPDGSINVVTATSGTDTGTSLQYDEITSVVSGFETPLTSLTIPISQQYMFSRAEVSGDNVATFSVKINSTLIDKKRTWWTNFQQNFEYFTGSSRGVLLQPGDTLQITVLHNSDSLGTFNCTLQGNFIVV